MNRRDFGKLLIAAPLIVATPALAGGAQNETPSTLKELSAWFEQNFYCVDGEKYAYFEHPRYGRVTYLAFAVTSFGEDAERRMVQQLYTDFFGLTVYRGAELFWRVRPELGHDEHDFPLHPEDTGPWRTGGKRVYFRMAIPATTLIPNRFLKVEGKQAVEI